MNSIPTVLFVCVSNNGKSVMAQALMHDAAGGRINATSAGTRAKEGVNAQSVEVLAELGIDISGHRATQINDELISAADLVVVLGTHAYVESGCHTPIETWNTDEPNKRGIEGIDRMRLIRDDIARRVQTLLRDLG